MTLSLPTWARTFDSQGQEFKVQVLLGDEVRWFRGSDGVLLEGRVVEITSLARVLISVDRQDGSPVAPFQRHVKPRFLSIYRNGERVED